MYASFKQNIVLFFAFRFLKSNRSVIPNLSVLMSALAITISISILIIVTSVMNGFTAELIEKILGLNSHISVYQKNGKFENITELQNKLLEVDGVKIAFPVVSGSGMVINNGNSAGVFIKGISKEDIANNKDLKKSIVADLDLFSGYKIILGKDIARQLRVRKNDVVNVIVPIISNTMFGTIPRQVKLKVLGVISSNSQQYDNYMAIIPFNASQIIFNFKDNASAMEIITDNPEDVSVIEQKIFKLGNFYIGDWKMENSALIHALNVEANVMSLILGLFVLISTFTIYAVIRMMIKSKEREIAILKAQGVSNTQIKNMFLIVGLTICISGMILGNICGITFALNVDKIRLFIENLLHTKLLDGDVYLLSNLPSRVIISDIIKTNIFAFTMAIFCVWLSIKRNTKIDVAKTLRNS